MSTDVCGPDGIPILKRLTAMEPELLLPPEKAEDEGYDADEDAVVEEEEDEEEEEEDAEECQKEDNGSLQNLMPLFPVLAIVCLAYLWGVAYALSSTRSVYPPAF